MKRTKRCAAALAVVLGLSLCSCGSTTDDPLAAAQKQMESVKSMDAHMTMEMDMQVMGQTMESVTTMDMTCFSEPNKLKAEMTMDMGELGSQSMSMYAEEKDGSYTMYVFDGSSWASQAAELSDLEQYDAKSSMNLYLDSGSDFQEDGTETINGVEAVKYTGVIRGDKLREVMEASGSLDSMSSLTQMGVTEDQIEEMLSDLGDMPVSIWIDTEDHYPVQYEMDMTSIMNGLMEKMMDVVGDEAKGLDLSVPKMLITMTCSHFNSATDFTIPEEALAA